jgi:hypothetical protein
MKSGVVTLTVRSGDGKLPRDLTLKRSASSGVIPSTQHNSSLQADRDRERGGGFGGKAAVAGRFEVTLVKETGRPLGLQLTDVKRSLQGNTAVAIRTIAPNSPAKRCGSLM